MTELKTKRSYCWLLPEQTKEKQEIEDDDDDNDNERKEIEKIVELTYVTFIVFDVVFVVKRKQFFLLRIPTKNILLHKKNIKNILN